MFQTTRFSNYIGIINILMLLDKHCFLSVPGICLKAHESCDQQERKIHRMMIVRVLGNQAYDIIQEDY